MYKHSQKCSRCSRKNPKLSTGMVGFVALQAGHGTTARLSHPGYRHQPTEWVPVDLQRTSGQPGPGPPAGFTQALYPAGILAHRLHPTCFFFFSNMLTTCTSCVYLSVFACRLLWSVQTSVIRVGFGSWADSGARGCVRNSTGRVRNISSQFKRPCLILKDDWGKLGMFTLCLCHTGG